MARSDGTISVKIKAEDTMSILGTFGANSAVAVSHALRVVARELLNDSKLYVPVLTGQLKDSGRLREVTINDAIQAVEVVYGRAPDVLYALKQHNHPYNHPSLGLYGPAKFLEKPLMLNRMFYSTLFITEYEIAIARNYK